MQAQVRALAAAAQLPNRARPDSQGICFLGHVRFPEFVKQHLGTMRGPLLEEETGRLVGVHQGVWFYTPGQRKGILLPGGPWCAASLHVFTRGFQGRKDAAAMCAMQPLPAG